jgi:hypothetical protein
VVGLFFGGIYDAFFPLFPPFCEEYTCELLPTLLCRQFGAAIEHSEYCLVAPLQEQVTYDGKPD